MVDFVRFGITEPGYGRTLEEDEQHLIESIGEETWLSPWFEERKNKMLAERRKSWFEHHPPLGIKGIYAFPNLPECIDYNMIPWRFQDEVYSLVKGEFYNEKTRGWKPKHSQEYYIKDHGNANIEKLGEYEDYRVRFENSDILCAMYFSTSQVRCIWSHINPEGKENEWTRYESTEEFLDILIKYLEENLGSQEYIGIEVFLELKD